MLSSYSIFTYHHHHHHPLFLSLIFIFIITTNTNNNITKTTTVAASSTPNLNINPIATAGSSIITTQDLLPNHIHDLEDLPIAVYDFDLSIRLALITEVKSFSLQYRQSALKYSQEDLIKILKEVASLASPHNPSNRSFMFQFLYFILKEWSGVVEENEVQVKLYEWSAFIPLLLEFILQSYPLSFLDLILQHINHNTNPQISSTTQEYIYQAAFSGYPLQTLIPVLGLLTTYFPTLPANRLSVPIGLTPKQGSELESLQYFLPLIKALNTKPPLDDLSTFVSIYKLISDLFYKNRNSHPLRLCPSHISVLDKIISSIVTTLKGNEHNRTLIRLLMVQIVKLVGQTFDDCEVVLLNCCRRNLRMFLFFFLQTNAQLSLTPSQLAYLFVQAKSSPDFIIYKVFIARFSISPELFNTHIKPVLLVCEVHPQIIDTIELLIPILKPDLIK